MHYASEQGHVECLQLLVNAGGRYDIRDSDGKTSLDLSTPGGRKILEKLCKLSLFCQYITNPREKIKMVLFLQYM